MAWAHTDNSATSNKKDTTCNNTAHNSHEATTPPRAGSAHHETATRRGGRGSATSILCPHMHTPHLAHHTSQLSHDVTALTSFAHLQDT